MNTTLRQPAISFFFSVPCCTCNAAVPEAVLRLGRHPGRNIEGGGAKRSAASKSSALASATRQRGRRCSLCVGIRIPSIVVMSGLERVCPSTHCGLWWVFWKDSHKSCVEFTSITKRPRSCFLRTLLGLVMLGVSLTMDSGDTIEWHLLKPNVFPADDLCSPASACGTTPNQQCQPQINADSHRCWVLRGQTNTCPRANSVLVGNAQSGLSAITFLVAII